MNPQPDQPATKPHNGHGRVLITGGGTGGHIYPGLAVAEAITRLAPQVEIRFAGTSRGLEADLVPQAGYPLLILPASGFRGLGFRARISFLVNTARGVLKALGIFIRWRPDLVLGTGGYVCVPAIVAARLLGIPCCLQEQNAVPGSANRFLGRWMKRVYLGFSSARKYFRAEVCRDTGNPVRRSVVESFKGSAAPELQAGNRRRVLIFGGSRGARTLNRTVMAAAAVWSERTDLEFLAQTGPEAWEEVQAGCREATNIKVISYIQDMASELARADLVICRAGAMTLAEIQCAGRPAILVPYPYATDNHQLHNAEDCATAGAAVVLEDKDCNASNLVPLVDELLQDELRLSRMGTAARAFARPDAAEEIAGDLLALSGWNADDSRSKTMSSDQDSKIEEDPVVR